MGTFGQVLFAGSPGGTQEKSIKKVIKQFAKAVETRDMPGLETILHADFRVVANRFKGGESAVVLSREAYLSMMQAGKIGGSPYQVGEINVSVHAHSASVEVTFEAKDHNMHIFLTLIQNAREQWQIVSDIPIMAKN